MDSHQAGQRLLRDLRQHCQVEGTCTAGPTNTGCTYCAGAQALTLFRSRVAGCDDPQPIPEVPNACDCDMSRCHIATTTSGAKATAGSRADVRRDDGPIQPHARRNRNCCSVSTIRALDGGSTLAQAPKTAALAAACRVFGLDSAGEVCLWARKRCCASLGCPGGAADQ